MRMDEGLERFVTAQARAWPVAEAELAAGAKVGHWMWFVFPQVAGLGSSDTARRYAIKDLAEARAYLAHPLLGGRLRRGVALMLGHRGRSARAILGQPDDLKFRSCLTLFLAAAEGAADGALFRQGLDAFYGGAPDPLTLERLGEPE